MIEEDLNEMITQAYYEGWNARQEGLPQDSNPWTSEPERGEWDSGWMAAPEVGK